MKVFNKTLRSYTLKTVMFTGIIQGSFPIKKLAKKADFLTLSVEFNDEFIEGLITGASVSVNGVCLTLTNLQGQTASFDVMKETLDITNLSGLNEGDLVNCERSLKYGDEVGGHLLSGHVDCTASVSGIEKSEDNHFIKFEIEKQWMKFILSKGYIGINGASLTIVDPDIEKGKFTVGLIPETLKQTNLDSLEIGSKVNIEIDRQTQAIVETTERVLQRA